MDINQKLIMALMAYEDETLNSDQEDTYSLSPEIQERIRLFLIELIGEERTNHIMDELRKKEFR